MCSLSAARRWPRIRTGNPDRSQEIGWSQGSDPNATYLASGGGISTVETQPAYQDGIQADLTAEGYPSGGYRTVPDVAYDADPGTGVPIYDTLDNTSLGIARLVAGRRHQHGRPQWSALVAIADQARWQRARAPSTVPTSSCPQSTRSPRPTRTPSTTSPAATTTIPPGLATTSSWDLALPTPSTWFRTSSRPTHAPNPDHGLLDRAAGDDSWNDPGNWSLVDHVPGNVLPGPNNNVVIDTSGVTINRLSASYDTIGSLSVTAQNVTLNLDSGTLDLSGPAPWAHSRWTSPAMSSTWRQECFRTPP